MITRRHTRLHERIIRSKKVGYSTATGIYCTTHDVKVPFFMPDFSIRKIILNHFHVDNDEGDSGIGYSTILGRYLMLKLGLMAKFKHQGIQWYVTSVPIKEPRSFLIQQILTRRKIHKVAIYTA